LILVQLKLLNGYGLSPLAVRRFDRADMFAFAAHDDDAPASELGGFFERDTPRHAGKIMAADRKGESASGFTDRAKGRSFRFSEPASFC